MRLTVNKFSGLRALRQVRGRPGAVPAERCGLAMPDPAPQQRLTARMLPLDVLALDAAPTAERRLDVATTSAAHRLQAAFAQNTVYARGLPEGSFVEVGSGVFASCPELAFVEAATYMSPMALVLLGYELCGTYARDARDPRCGDVVFDVQKATTVADIRSYIGRCSRVRGTVRALELLDYVRDNAWSPMEAIVCALALMPVAEDGYGLGEAALNVRRPNPAELVSLGCKESRVPDIEIVGTHIGFNYDGRGHFDVRDASEDVGQARDARTKYVDDLRRNRELIASTGRVVLPVTAEDLFQEGGLDAVMLEAALTMERRDGFDPTHVKTAVRTPGLKNERQRVIWSLLPWPAGDDYARRVAEGLERLGEPREVFEARMVIA